MKAEGGRRKAKSGLLGEKTPSIPVPHQWTMHYGQSESQKLLPSAFRLPPSDFPNSLSQSRRGSALLVVLVVMLLLTLSAYTYTQTMQTEFEAAVMQGQELQARQAADSGVEYAATLLAKRTLEGGENFQQNPALFQAIPVVDTNRARFRARFTIVAAIESDPQASRLRYGLVDESAKLNLNLLDQIQKDLKLKDEDITTWLTAIPGMTAEHVDAIRDWIDADGDKRPLGAEAETYQALNPPYSAKNGPLESLDELLLVRGVTAQLLYGEDANRNGLLDVSENDGDASMPLDNADGLLNHGWSAFFTVHSRERNLRADGQAKINLNQGMLTELFDTLQQEFDEDTAKFIVAYRMSGPKAQPSSSGSKAKSTASKSGSGNGGKSGGSGGGGKTSSANGSAPSNSSTGGSKGSASGGSSGSSSTPSKQDQQQMEQALLALTQQMAQSMFQKGGKVTRGGLDLSQGGGFRIKSIFDLIGSEVQTKVNGATTTLASPWAADPGQLQSKLPQLMDALSTTDDTHRPGRININEARPEILMGMPEMTQDIVQSISAAQMRNVQGTPSADVMRRHSTAGWIYLDGLVDLDLMRKLDPYLTARGDVYRAQVLGFFDGSGLVHREEAIIDATRVPPRVIWQRDLNELGRGYQPTQLAPAAAQ